MVFTLINILILIINNSKNFQIQRIGHQDVSKEKKQNEENQKSPKRSSLLITVCM